MTPDTAADTAVRVFVSGGSNIEPERHLRTACEDLRSVFGNLIISSTYLTKAVGFDGDDFLNLVLSFTTTTPVEDVVAMLDGVESAAGRKRLAGRFTPRTLDLDLLMYGDAVIDTPDLKLPREDIVKYAFVLGPLAELSPDLIHPLNGRTMRELWSQFEHDELAIQRLREPRF